MTPGGGSGQRPPHKKPGFGFRASAKTKKPVPRPRLLDSDFRVPGQYHARPNTVKPEPFLLAGGAKSPLAWHLSVLFPDYALFRYFKNSPRSRGVNLCAWDCKVTPVYGVCQ